MEVTTILIIVNICVSAIATPLVLGVVDIMKRLKKSDCLGAHIELQDIKRTESKVNVNVENK